MAVFQGNNKFLIDREFLVEVYSQLCYWEIRKIVHVDLLDTLDGSQNGYLEAFKYLLGTNTEISDFLLENNLCWLDVIEEIMTDSRINKLIDDIEGEQETIDNLFTNLDKIRDISKKCINTYLDNPNSFEKAKKAIEYT